MSVITQLLCVRVYCNSSTQSVPLRVSAASFRPVRTNDDRNTTQLTERILEGYSE